MTRAPLIALIATALVWPACGEDAHKRRRKRGPAAVEVAAVKTGAIELRRTFTGSVRSKRSFVVAAHVAGRVQRLYVDLSDEVKRGQVVAELDDKEDKQGVTQASAELAVARARLAEARAALVIAKRDLARITGLHAQGVVPVSDLDQAKARHLAAKTAVSVAAAQLNRMGAGLQTARIRKDYNKVMALWTGPDRARAVAQRHVSVGDRVTAGQPLFTVVDLEPILVVVNVGEKDYGSLAIDQVATVTTAALPGKRLTGKVKRIAPVFREASRQARVELEVANKDHALKPGMFVRVRVVLRRKKDATIVPFAALTTRGGKTGVFVVNSAGDKVKWQPITVGIRQGDMVEVVGGGVTGRVVTLGQQLVRDGSRITIPSITHKRAPGKAKRKGRTAQKEQGQR